MFLKLLTTSTPTSASLADVPEPPSFSDTTLASTCDLDSIEYIDQHVTATSAEEDAVVKQLPTKGYVTLISTKDSNKNGENLSSGTSRDNQDAGNQGKEKGKVKLAGKCFCVRLLGKSLR